jgi:hypothetical protein
VFRILTRAIFRTAPLSCDPKANCELHTMLCARDVPLYLVAIKSLLRYRRSFAVVVHSDGSLRPEHELVLAAHVPGTRFINAAAADAHAESALAGNPFLLEWRRADIPSVD